MFERPHRQHFYGLPLNPPRLRRMVDEATCAALLREAEEVLQGRWRFFAFADAPSDPTPDGMTDWHRCEVTGRRTDPDAPGAALDPRDPELGDVRTIWEKSRHHHTTLLAVAYTLSGEPRYAVGAAARIADWIRANPPRRGVNWISAAEAGLRLMAWAWCYELLRPHPEWGAWFGPASPLWPSVYRHQVLVQEAVRSGRPAGSDLLAALGGQYVASVTWPVFSESAGWQREAKAALTREATLQFFESGVSREPSFSRHVWATELLLLPALLGERCADAFHPAYLARLARAIRAVDRLRGPGDLLPRYGDSDERLTVQLEPRSASRVDWLLRVGRDWLGVPVPEPRGGRLGATLLLGDHRVPLPCPGEDAGGQVAYPDAGLYVLSAGQGAPREVRVLSTVGPLAFPPPAGQGAGHADALSFTLAVGPQEVVVDPGVYAGPADAGWPRAFHSTAAHNTVEVDGQDQSPQAGASPWGRGGAVAHLWEPREEGGRLVASHDGYERLPGAPVHHRELDLDARRLSVTDHLEGQGRHLLRLHLHLHPDCEVQPEAPSVWRVAWPGGALRVRFDPRLQVRCGQGEDAPDTGDPPLGWYFPRYGARQASPSLRATLTATLPITLHTTLEVL
ncbi:heparinase II/III family protein [Deinococcus planocerae]|uniref:heparinase II/III family protein n=1 Tax=Deinococcus planocerae TaxID=1737569 RepID=UPI0011AEF1E7|nr:alginate lyase family protein [Deinococcus planocerae]